MINFVIRLFKIHPILLKIFEIVIFHRLASVFDVWISSLTEIVSEITNCERVPQVVSS